MLGTKCHSLSFNVGAYTSSKNLNVIIFYRISLKLSESSMLFSMHSKISFLLKTYETAVYFAMAFSFIFLFDIKELYPKTFMTSES